jgi:opacity protein-like surface antigen
MKKYFLLFISILWGIVVFSQSKTELGLLLGTSYYQGDINSSRLFYAPSPALGLLVKYNFSDHLTSTLKSSYGKLKGDDADFSDIENQLRGASFSTSYFDVSMMLEFNFFPYNSSGYIEKNKKRFSPFMFAGVGVNYLFHSGGFENPVTIPFGLGIKYNIFERLTIGVEWSYSKTFDDQVDGVLNIQDEANTPIIHNDDWYSFCGVFVTYKIFRDKIDCPTYDD